MTDHPQINRSWQAPAGYREEFDLACRLGGLLAYGVACGQLSDEEADLVETAVTDEARSRHAAERRAEEFQRWQVETAARLREESERSEAEWAERVDARSRHIERMARAGAFDPPSEATPDRRERGQQEAEAC